jgi:hypothetical protein
MVGVDVGAGVDVGFSVTVGETSEVGVTGVTAGVRVVASTTGDGVGEAEGGGGGGTTQRLQTPPAPVRQATSAIPAKVHRAAAPQSSGVGTCSRATRMLAAVWKR